MAGGIVIGAHEIEVLRRRMLRAAQAELDEVLGEIGQTLEDSARRRIAETKRAPDGKRWPSWSARYAKTRSAQHSLLRGEGNLLDSLSHEVDASSHSVFIGSNVEYAGRHLFGDFGFIGPVRGGRIPARPYLDTTGEVSDPHDRQEIRDIVRAFMRGMFS